jgi:tetratricopeptide (TPR) repeat protein/GTPase Era involved in 16S rRNA processing
VDLFDRFNRLASQFGDLLGEIADEARPHVELGAALLQRGDFDAAIVELEQALKKRPDHARAFYLLGLCYLKRGKPGDAALARKQLEQALAVREGYPDAYIALGDALRQGGEYDAAVDSYRAALPLLGDAAERAEVERSLGALYLEAGQIDKAVRELRKAASALPEDAGVQGLLGQALIKSAQRRGEPVLGPTFEAARQCLIRATRSDGNLHPDGRALAALGGLLLQTDQLPDAERALHRALKEQPELVSALLSLGQLRLLQGDVAAAYEQGLRAYASLRNDARAEAIAQRADVRLLLARCHQKSGEPQRALAAFDEAIKELPPDAPQRAVVLGEALQLALSSGQLLAAAALGKQPPLDVSPDGLAAQALQPELPLADAEALLGRALAAGDTLEVRLAAAALDLAKGQKATAAAHLRRAAALSPSDPRPRKQLAELYQREREALPHELYGLLQRAHEILSQSPELSALGPDAAKIVELYDRPLLVTVMGEFNSGKSTFVNALLGDEVAPMGITPTTATINLLKYGRERSGRVIYRDGQSRVVPWAKVAGLLRGLDGEEARRIRLVEVLYPLDILQRVNVVDTPGLNSILPEHEATAREFIAQADAVIWLFTVDQAGKQSEREALRSIAAAGKKILGVLNKIDRLESLEPVSGLQAILDHLRDPAEGLIDLLDAIVPFSGREALYGRKQNDAERLARANLPALEQALEERFFARSQAIKTDAARGRLLSLLDRARGQAQALHSPATREQLDKDLRLLSADGLLFQRDFIPAERKRLIADAETAHLAAARETLDFVRPKRWPFAEHQAAPADRDFLLALLDEKLGQLAQASRTRVSEQLGIASGDDDFSRLLSEQVYSCYRAFARGFLRGGKVDDFFVRVLPKLELSEAAIGRALERDSPTAVEILEAELLSPLRAFGETLFRKRTASLRKKLDDEELRRLDIEERLIFPLDALRDAVAQLVATTT